MSSSRGGSTTAGYPNLHTGNFTVDVAGASIIPASKATGVSNTYTVTMKGVSSYSDLLAIRVKFDVASTGAISVNLNGLGAKAVVDYYGQAVTDVRANLIATLAYDATNGNFQLLGKGGGGTATAAQILTGQTATTNAGKITGTMPNNGAVAPSALSAGSSYTIPAGYHNGSGKVTAASLASQTSATATAAQILLNQTAWVGGSKLTGTMPNNGAVAPAALAASGSYTIPAGYHHGSGKVTAASLASQTSATATAAQILLNQTAWVGGSKLTGTMPNLTNTILPTNASGTTVSLTDDPEYPGVHALIKNYSTGTGYVDNSTANVMRIGNLNAGNIKAGVRIGSTAASPATNQYITGTFTSDGTITAGDMLAGKIGYSNGSKITGTMPNYSAVDTSASSIDGTYRAGRLYVRAKPGYYESTKSIMIDDANFIAENIRANTSIFGLNGTFTGDATINPWDVLVGHIGYNNGSKITGTLAPQFANIIRDGSFEKGGSAWYNLNCSIWNNGSFHGSNYVQTISNDSSPSYFYQDIPIPTGHKVYATCMAYKYSYTSGSRGGLLLYEYGGFSGIGDVVYVTSNAWTRISTVGTSNNNGIRVLIGRPSSGVEVSLFDTVLIIDMTASGIENLSVAELDSIVTSAGGWWDSSMTALTSDGTITAADILSGKIGYSNGSKITGTIPVINNQNNYPAELGGPEYVQSMQAIFLKPPKGYHDPTTTPTTGGWIYAIDPDFVASNILNTANIFGLQGSIPVKSTNDNWVAPDMYTVPTRIYVKPFTAYHTPSGTSGTPGSIGGWLRLDDPDFIAANILSSANIFGLQGTAPDIATGTVTNGTTSGLFAGFGSTPNANYYYFTVSGLTFKPRFIVAYDTNDKYAGAVKYAECRFSAGRGTISFLEGTYSTQDYSGGTAYVNSTGFCLPMYSPGVSVTWFAIK